MIDGWLAIPQFSPFVELDAFQLMPNHLHGILRFKKIEQGVEQPNRFGPQRQNLASVIRGFKAGVTDFATRNKMEFGWQARYHDRVIRNDDELQRIRTYIAANPTNWLTDKLYIPVETQSLASPVRQQPLASPLRQQFPASPARQPNQTVSEEMLYFLWQFQYFATQPLRTTDGESVEVIHPGHRNGNAGPDFLNARLRIDGVEWVGTVEAHVKTSDWLAHRHQNDRAYDNVILHIVWQHDRTADSPVPRPDGTALPTLELAPLVLDGSPPNLLLTNYQRLIDTRDPIPCAGQFRMVKPLRQTAMLDKALLQRLEHKAEAVRELYDATGHDWEETAYRLLATYLGSKVNAEPMEQLVRAVPLRVLQKHRNSLLQIEALLLGTSGLIPAPDDENDDFTVVLRREYQFLVAKYNLADRQLPAHIWKWGKLRPAGFPTMRLAQLAALVQQHGSLFSLLIDGANDVPALLNALQVRPSAYWQTHFQFGKVGKKASAMLGTSTAQGLLINTVAPLLAAYAQHKELPDLLDRAVSLLEQLPAEDNRITRLWDDLGLHIRSAFDSQAALELYNGFCLPKRCLNCQIGIALVRAT
ncbi:DUF2851 family protein [Fibrella musci]|uniref:DUF2851 family protein n=1 Tax=Fibrella musci TaxID=3242485 RepID=UPI0035220822